MFSHKNFMVLSGGHFVHIFNQICISVSMCAKVKDHKKA